MLFRSVDPFSGHFTFQHEASGRPFFVDNRCDEKFFKKQTLIRWLEFTLEFARASIHLTGARQLDGLALCVCRAQAKPAKKKSNFFHLGVTNSGNPCGLPG